MLSMDVIIEPPIEILQMDFAGLGLRIWSFKEPLTKSVRDVVRASFWQNFEDGGRPDPWEPLSEQTIERKGHDTILVDTGLLMKVAQQMNLWTIGSFDAFIEHMPRAEYGIWHQLGTRYMPQRPWAVLQDPEDLDAIQEIFEEWLDDKVSQSGF